MGKKLAEDKPKVEKKEKPKSKFFILCKRIKEQKRTKMRQKKEFQPFFSIKKLIV
jgi:hypothetical protein